MGKSLREKAIMAMLGVIVLYAIAVGIWFFSAESAWKKAAKNYAEADRIRAELTAMGVTLVDTKDGTTYTVAN